MHEGKALENNRKSGLIAHDVLKNLSGLEIFQKMVAGELLMPPFAETLDYTLVEVERGRVVFGGHPKLAFSNPLGTIHGGYLATLLDSAMACAVHTTLEAGKGLHESGIQNQFRASGFRVNRIFANRRENYQRRQTNRHFGRQNNRRKRQTLRARHDDFDDLRFEIKNS